MQSRKLQTGKLNISSMQTPRIITARLYVDDITVFDICNNARVSMLQQSVDVITN